MKEKTERIAIALSRLRCDLYLTEEDINLLQEFTNAGIRSQRIFNYVVFLFCMIAYLTIITLYILR